MTESTSGTTRKGKRVPIIPKLPPGEPDLDPNPVVAICGECGLEVHRVMAYSCMNARCPVQRRTTC